MWISNAKINTLFMIKLLFLSILFRWKIDLTNYKNRWVNCWRSWIIFRWTFLTDNDDPKAFLHLNLTSFFDTHFLLVLRFTQQFESSFCRIEGKIELIRKGPRSYINKDIVYLIFFRRTWNMVSNIIQNRSLLRTKNYMF